MMSLLRLFRTAVRVCSDDGSRMYEVAAGDGYILNYLT